MIPNFESRKSVLAKEYQDIPWIEDSGLGTDELKEEILKVESKGYPLCITKAKTFEMIASKAKLSADKENVFQEKILSKSKKIFMSLAAFL